MFVFFFFSSRRRHTRFDCDWSSDVCSSDLFGAEGFRIRPVVDGIYVLGGGVIVSAQVLLMVVTAALLSLLFFLFFERSMSGRALRATAVNRIGARLVGIRPARTG